MKALWKYDSTAQNVLLSPPLIPREDSQEANHTQPGLRIARPGPPAPSSEHANQVYYFKLFSEIPIKLYEEHIYVYMAFDNVQNVDLAKSAAQLNGHNSPKQKQCACFWYYYFLLASFTPQHKLNFSNLQLKLFANLLFKWYNYFL